MYNSDDTTETLMAKSGITWEVEQQDCFIDRNGKPEKIGRKALVRNDNGKVLTVTGDNWKPVPNRQVIDFFYSVVKETGSKLTKLGELRGGKGIWAFADIGAGFELKGGDKVSGNMLFVSFHQVGKATYYCATPIRLWCENSIALAFKNKTAGVKQNHMRSFDFDKASNAVGVAREQITEFAGEAKKLQKLMLSEEESFSIFAKHFVVDNLPSNVLDEMLNGKIEQPLLLKQVLHSYNKAPGAQVGTGWGVLNAVTHWADHTAGNKPSARFDRATFGSNARLKLDVKQDLLALA